MISLFSGLAVWVGDFTPGVHAELAEDRGDVVIHCLWGNVESLGYVTVAQPLPEELEHVGLPGGQTVGVRQCAVPWHTHASIAHGSCHAIRSGPRAEAFQPHEGVANVVGAARKGKRGSYGQPISSHACAARAGFR
jgi:hypothetical protein